jgi:transposase-like protein
MYNRLRHLCTTSTNDNDDAAAAQHALPFHCAQCAAQTVRASRARCDRTTRWICAVCRGTGHDSLNITERRLVPQPVVLK